MTELLQAQTPPEVRDAAGPDRDPGRPAWRRALPVLAVAVAFTVIAALLVLGVIASPGAAGGCGGG